MSLGPLGPLSLHESKLELESKDEGTSSSTVLLPLAFCKNFFSFSLDLMGVPYVPFLESPSSFSSIVRGMTFGMKGLVQPWWVVLIFYPPLFPPWFYSFKVSAFYFASLMMSIILVAKDLVLL